jgi:hypothetical protein
MLNSAMPVGPSTPSLPRGERLLHPRLYHRHQQKHDRQRVEHQNHGQRWRPTGSLKIGAGPDNQDGDVPDRSDYRCRAHLLADSREHARLAFRERLGGCFLLCTQTMPQLFVVSGNFHIDPSTPSRLRHSSVYLGDAGLQIVEPDLWRHVRRLRRRPHGFRPRPRPRRYVQGERGTRNRKHGRG